MTVKPYLNTSPVKRLWDKCDEGTPGGYKAILYVRGMAGFALSLPVRAAIVAYRVLTTTVALLKAMASLITGDRLKLWKECGKEAFLLVASVAEVATGVMGVLFPTRAYKAELKLYKNVMGVLSRTFDCKDVSKGQIFTQLKGTGVTQPLSDNQPTPVTPLAKLSEDHKPYVRPLELEAVSTEPSVRDEDGAVMNFEQRFDQMATALSLEGANPERFGQDPLRIEVIGNALDALHQKLRVDYPQEANRLIYAAARRGEDTYEAVMESLFILHFLIKDEASPGVCPPELKREFQSEWDAVKGQSTHLVTPCMELWLTGANPGGVVGAFATKVRDIQQQSSTYKPAVWRNIWAPGIQAWLAAHPGLNAQANVGPDLD